MTERDPIITAKEVASVDVLSGGRMNFGVGPGWINQEIRNHGTDPDHRWKVMRERVEAMQQIWTHDIASYHGDFVGFDRITSWPKPFRKPHPPILVAGNGPNVAKRVIAYGDEWIPMLRPHVLDHITEFKKTVPAPTSPSASLSSAANSTTSTPTRRPASTASCSGSAPRTPRP
ncbi:LLM class flavin-dependent oxidoreductase [Streptomyces acidicola]|uniref:LLM class flavin-dependent oxidoreductase n=1 Tax=Streptomyces acidicola TaxID=2596892 RepID=UPI0037A68B02